MDEALGSSLARDLEVEVFDEFDDSFDDLFERVAAVVPCTAEKDAAFFALALWSRFPQSPVTVLGVRSGGVARLRRAQSRLPRPGRLHTRPDGASRASGRRAGLLREDGTFLQADGRPDSRTGS